ncbi:MAG: hypothetical protein RI885_2289 [Actinomycetota bacterium]|jgi:hypothetical protein
MSPTQDYHLARLEEVTERARLLSYARFTASAIARYKRLKRELHAAWESAGLCISCGAETGGHPHRECDECNPPDYDYEQALGSSLGVRLAQVRPR